MLKRVLTLLLSVSLIFSLAGVALAAEPETETEAEVEAEAAEPEPELESEVEPGAVEEPSNFFLNGTPVYGMCLTVVDGVPCCALRTFFDSVLAEGRVSWIDNQAEVDGVTPAGQELTLTARPGACYMTANGRYLYVDGKVRLIDGVTMVPVAALASVFEEHAVSWDEETGVVEVTLGESLIAPGEEFYHEKDLDLIARVISLEAGYECLEGKIALGGLIMNRVGSSSFPNTVYDVLYQKNQFTVVKSSRFWKVTPSADCVLAARLALEGVSLVPNAVFYNRVGLNSWAARNRTFVATIGNHSFYA